MSNDLEAAKESYKSFVRKLMHQSTQVSGSQNTSPLVLSQIVIVDKFLEVHPELSDFREQLPEVFGCREKIRIDRDGWMKVQAEKSS